MENKTFHWTALSNCHFDILGEFARIVFLDKQFSKFIFISYINKNLNKYKYNLITEYVKNNNKMVVLDVTTLNEIKLFIKNYEGLTIDCEMSIRSHYPKIDPLTLGSIVNKEAQQRMKENYGYMSSKRIVTKICKE